MVTWLIDYLTASAGVWTYPLVMLLVALDGLLFLGCLLPGEAPLIVGGCLCRDDHAARPPLLAPVRARRIETK